MKFLVIFVASLICVQAQFPFIFTTSLESPESPESRESPESIEDIRLILSQRRDGLPGVGVVNQPVLQAVKVKVPRPNKQQLIAQAIQNLGAQSALALSAQVLNRQNVPVQQQQVQTLSVQGVDLPVLQQKPQPLTVQSFSLPDVDTQTPQTVLTQGIVEAQTPPQPPEQQQQQIQLQAQDQAQPQSPPQAKPQIESQVHIQSEVQLQPQTPPETIPAPLPQPQSQPQSQALPQLQSVSLPTQGLTLQDLLNIQQQLQPLSAQSITLQDLLYTQQQPQLLSAQISTHQHSPQVQPISAVQSLTLPNLSLEPDQVLRDRRQTTTNAPIKSDHLTLESTTTTTPKTIDPDTVRYTVEEEASDVVGVTKAPIIIKLLDNN